MAESSPAPTFSSRVAYRDCRAAVEWLEKVLGFETQLLATDGKGNVIYAELRLGDGWIQIGGEWDNIKAPATVGGANTQTICVHLGSGLDAHYERVRQGGAKILQEPQDQFHGDRTYRVVDPQGHIWAFSQKLRDVSLEELESAIPGMKVSIPAGSLRKNPQTPVDSL